MTLEKAQANIANGLMIGLSVITIFVTTGSVTDPVNAPKMMILGALGGFLLACIVSGFKIVTELRKSKFLLTIVVFVIWALVISIKSPSPFSQNLYGVYGRNTGLITYSFFAIIAISTALLSQLVHYKKILFGFLFAVSVNIIYCSWVTIFGDFVGWQNPYGAILGTFGNPNFISAFFGMSIGPMIILFLHGSFRSKIVAAVAIAIVIFLIMQADSLQGIVISFIGVWVVLLFELKKSFKSNKVTCVGLASGIFLGLVAVIGAFGSGPLSRIMAQPTIVLREQYWYAAWKIFISHPVFGVGMDSYGDWYRRARGEQALVTPGPEVTTNAAHNVFLDLLSYGGLPLFIFYAIITIIPLGLIANNLFQNEEFNPVIVSLFSIYITYQFQSMISINQIGLAIWGWALSGAIYSVSKINHARENTEVNRISTKLSSGRTRSNRSNEFAGIISMAGILVGIIVSSPPYISDIKWTTALKKKQVETLEIALSNTYFTPVNTSRLGQASEMLENSNLTLLAVKYARKGVAFNSQSTLAWQILLNSKEATVEERELAKERLILLDPLNTKWKNIG